MCRGTIASISTYAGSITEKVAPYSTSAVFDFIMVKRALHSLKNPKNGDNQIDLSRIEGQHYFLGASVENEQVRRVFAFQNDECKGQAGFRNGLTPLCAYIITTSPLSIPFCSR